MSKLIFLKICVEGSGIIGLIYHYNNIDQFQYAIRIFKMAFFRVENIPETMPMYTSFMHLVKHLPFKDVMQDIPEESAVKMDKLAVQMKELMNAWKQGPEDTEPLSVSPRCDEAIASETDPFFETHKEMFPCLISSLGTGCNLSRVSNISSETNCSIFIKLNISQRKVLSQIYHTYFTNLTSFLVKC